MATYVVADAPESVRVVHIAWAGRRHLVRSRGLLPDSSGDGNHYLQAEGAVWFPSGAKQVPPIAGDVQEHGNPSVGLCAW